MFAELNTQKTFGNYIECLKTQDLQDIVGVLNVQYDISKNRIISSCLMNDEKQADDVNYNLKYCYREPPIILGGKLFYSSNIIRNTKSVPLAISHIYLSNYEHEKKSLQGLKDNIMGLRCFELPQEDKKYQEMVYNIE